MEDLKTKLETLKDGEKFSYQEQNNTYQFNYTKISETKLNEMLNKLEENLKKDDKYIQSNTQFSLKENCPLCDQKMIRTFASYWDHRQDIKQVCKKCLLLGELAEDNS